MGADSSDNLARLYSEMLVLLKQEEEIRKETDRVVPTLKATIDAQAA